MVFASDVNTFTYKVINHSKNEATSFKFKINPTLKQASIQMLEKTEIPKDLIQGNRFD